MLMLTGSCHCGTVQFSVDRKLGDVRYCYCTTCRKLSGSAFSAVAFIPTSLFSLNQGSDQLAVYESSPGKHRHYCATCHAPIYVAVSASPDQVRIRLEVLDTETDVNISAHMWVSEKPRWHKITDNLPQYETEYKG